MQAWRIDFARPRYGPGSLENRANAFVDGIIGFHASVAVIRGDFTGKNKERLDELVAAVP